MTINWSRASRNRLLSGVIFAGITATTLALGVICWFTGDLIAGIGCAVVFVVTGCISAREIVTGIKYARLGKR